MMKLSHLIGALSICLAIPAGCHADDVLSPLLENLSSKERSQRVDALNALAELGPAVQPAMRRIVPFLGAVAIEERDAALRVFERLGSTARDALPELVALAIDTRLRDQRSHADLAIAAIVAG